MEAKKAFEDIKTTLTKTPVLTSPKFDKDFIIFSFASEHNIVVVLLQKDDQGCEKLIEIPDHGKASLRACTIHQGFQSLYLVLTCDSLCSKCCG